MAAIKSKIASKRRPPAAPGKAKVRAKPTAALAAAAASVASDTITRSKPMNEQFTRQAQDMFKAAQEARMPEALQAMAEDGVSKTREAYQKMQSAAKDNAKVVEDLVLAAQAGAKAIGDKVIENTTMNTEAAFDAAKAIARARSLPEAARLQADFMQQQLAVASTQTKEFFELSTKVARQTLESMNAAATKSFDQTRR